MSIKECVTQSIGQNWLQVASDPMGVSLFVVRIFWKIFSENRIKDELFGGGGTIKPPSSLDRAIVHTHTRTRTRTRTHPDRILSGAALVLMELIRRRMVIQTRRLWAVRVESCRDSDSGVQQLHVLPHGHHSRNGVMVSVFEEDPDEKYYKERIFYFFFGVGLWSWGWGRRGLLKLFI